MNEYDYRNNWIQVQISGFDTISLLFLELFPLLILYRVVSFWVLSKQSFFFDSQFRTKILISHNISFRLLKFRNIHKTGGFVSLYDLSLIHI